MTEDFEPDHSNTVRLQHSEIVASCKVLAPGVVKLFAHTGAATVALEIDAEEVPEMCRVLTAAAEVAK